MSHIPVRPLRSWATLLLVLGLCSLLAADHGPRQRALDLWMTYRDADAAAAFEKLGGDPIARLNSLQIRAMALIRELEAGPDNARAMAIRQELRTMGRQCQTVGSNDRTIRFLASHHGGRLLLAAGDTLAALGALKSARSLDPGNQQNGRLLLVATEKLGSPTDLETAARQQLKDRPDNPWCWWFLGKALQRQGRQAEALDQWRQGLEVFPLRPMLEAAIREAGPRDPARSRAWLETLARRYTHVYDDSLLHGFARAQGVEHLLAGLPSISSLRERENRGFPQFFPVGREWEYAVSFGIIPLGSLIVGVRGEETIPDSGGRKAMRVYYKIDSNPIYTWLIDLHDEYESLIPLHCLHSLEFNQFSTEGNDRYENKYRSDFQRGEMSIRGYHKAGDVHIETLPLAQEVFDGLSLLYAARRQVRENTYGPVLTVVDEEMHRTLIEPDGRDEIKLGNRRQPVIKVHGLADYQGIAGLTGEFWGSFTDDAKALPVEAKFQIKVGRISLKLKDTRDR